MFSFLVKSGTFACPPEGSPFRLPVGVGNLAASLRLHCGDIVREVRSREHRRWPWSLRRPPRRDSRVRSAPSVATPGGGTQHVLGGACRARFHCATREFSLEFSIHSLWPSGRPRRQTLREGRPACEAKAQLFARYRPLGPGVPLLGEAAASRTWRPRDTQPGARQRAAPPSSPSRSWERTSCPLLPPLPPFARARP